MCVDYKRQVLVTKTGQLHFATLLFLVMMSLFVSLSVHFAIHLKRDIVPDESTHLAFSQFFSTSWGIPPDRPETYSYGSMQYKPFLYYWINGRLINLLQWIFPEPGSWKILVTLRLTSVVYATLAVLFCYLTAREVLSGRYWQLIVVFSLTNTLMFVFLSGGANYDSLVNLCCFAGIYFLIRVLDGKAFLPNSLGWMICILTGSLVKLTVLPLLAIMTLIWVIHTIRRRARLKFKPFSEWRIIFLLVLFTGPAAGNFALYGLNLLRFRALIPTCSMVLTEDQCQQNAMFVRGESFSDSEKFTLADMFNGNVYDPWVWFDDFWVVNMLKMIYGIHGYLIYHPPDLTITFFRLWLEWLLLVAVRFWKRPSSPVSGLLAIAGFYLLILLQTNLSSELNTGFKHLGIQGRYLFPVIGSLYILMAHYMATIPNRLISSLTAAAILVLFASVSPLWLLSHPEPVLLPIPGLTAEAHNLRIGEGAEVSQEFVSACPGKLTRVSVLFAPTDLDALYPVRFRLTDLEAQRAITDQTLIVTSGGEQTWFSIPLSPLEDTQGRRYRLSLTAGSDASNSTLAVWHTSTNIYLFGDAFVQDTPTNYDLIFHYTCKMPLLSEWFISNPGR